MTMTIGARPRAVLAALGTLGLALTAAVSPASAAGGTPTTPTQLFNGYRNCSTDADRPSYRSAHEGLVVMGIPGTTDTSADPLMGVRYQVWPVSDPTQVTTVARDRVSPGFEAPVTLPASALADGQTYAWQARSVIGDAVSDWTAPCYITIDNTRPANAPTISSPNYPPEGWTEGGEPVEFTLGANGADDVEGYEFSWQQDLPVIGVSIGEYGIPQPVDPYENTKYFKRADTLGGSATLKLIPPSGSGPMTLWVRSLDRAYNGSATASYRFYVGSAGPTITPSVPNPEFGEPTDFTFRPDPGLQAKSPVVSYSVQTVGGRNDRTFEIPADADGTATTRLTLDGEYGESLQVSSKSANGWVSDRTWWGVSYDTTPTVTSAAYPENGSSGGAGVPGTFTFTPKVKDVVSYTYTFNNGDPEVTVPAAADHTASVDWTPPTDGWYDLTVYATTGSGLRTASYDYYFTVN
ncbi:large secreted protein [Streptomyces lincolnensis]|uniref:Large secreted protein n=2 Tax=Streptomyces lincolnensis TaxID=1915 RepID=A0A1B1MDQ4_STRLN|nr:large secreted protein [Streptomyces lincolnensis]AXG55565.1 large secreted protein [Streptomyces lincolnensis]